MQTIIVILLFLILLASAPVLVGLLLPVAAVIGGLYILVKIGLWIAESLRKR